MDEPSLIHCYQFLALPFIQIIAKQHFCKASSERTPQIRTVQEFVFLPESRLLCFPVALELHPACQFLAINLHSTGLCFDWRDKCQSKRAGESREQFRQKSKICLHFERDQDVRGVTIQRGIARPFQVVSLIFKKVN